MKSTLFVLLLFAAAARAQYAIDWSTMDSGGGSGTAGPYAFSGILGQPDATSGAAGSVVFLGGYWSLFGEELPVLEIFFDGPDIILAWPILSPGFVLQAAPELLNAVWGEVAIAPQIVGSEKQVLWGPPVGRHFFRLHRP